MLGLVLFLQTNFEFVTNQFWWVCYFWKSIVVLISNSKRYLWSFSVNLSFCSLYGVSGWFSQKKVSNVLFIYFFHFILLHLIFSCYYCTIVPKRQSEHSGLYLDTTSLVVPTFDTKITEYLCSGWVNYMTVETFRALLWYLGSPICFKMIVPRNRGIIYELFRFYGKLFLWAWLRIACIFWLFFWAWY